MTRDELRALVAERPTVPLLTAFAAIDVSETAGRKAYARGELPFRVIRVGKALRAVSCDLEALLLTPDKAMAGPASPTDALTDEAHEGAPRHDQCAPAPALRSVSR
jgi:hypothetical protein